MIAQNYKIVLNNINERCVSSNRNADEIQLIAVSKTFPLSVIDEAFKYGIKEFGENKAQELRDKARDNTNDLIWHFIGHLQKNKVKYVVGTAEYIHAVDSIELAEEINKRADSLNISQKILVEINTSGEDSKYGLRDIDSLHELVEHCGRMDSLSVEGLMTMAPFTEDEAVVRNAFIKLRESKEKINSFGYNLSQLSMGMTNDYLIAIEEGATMLRIGSAIFGERKLKV
jgi:pyridoxal phosphate enzyme (YggS family)